MLWLNSFLERHKVYFETIGWVALTLMSICVSCQANGNGRAQTSLLAKQTALLDSQAEQTKRQVKLLESQVNINRVAVSPSFSFGVDYGLDGVFKLPNPAVVVNNNGARIFDESGTMILYWELRTKAGVTKRIQIKGIVDVTGFVLGEKMYFYYNDLHNRYTMESIPFDWWKAKWGRFNNYAFLAIHFKDVLGIPRKEQYLLRAIDWSLPNPIDEPPKLDDAVIDLSPFEPKDKETEKEASQRMHDASLTFKNAIDALDR